MSDLPVSGVELRLEGGHYERGMKSAISGADKLDSALGDVVGAASRAETALNSIKGNIDVRIGAAVDDTEILATQGLIDSLTQTENIGLTVDDTRVRTALGTIDDLSQTERVNLTVDDSEATSALSEIERKLQTLTNLAKIDLILNLPANLQSIIEGLSAIPGFGQVIENQQVANINQVSGGNQADVDIARNLYAGAFVETVTEGLRLVNEISRTGVIEDDLPAAVQSTVDLQTNLTQITGQYREFNELVLAQSQLVNSGLASSYTEAADALTVLFQTVPAEDALETVAEYASTFAEANFTLQETFSFLANARQSGFMDTDKAADLIREGRIRVSNPDETTAQDAINELGLRAETEAFLAGEITGGAYFDGVLASIAAEGDTGTRNRLLENIFGTQTEDLGSGAVFDLSSVNDVFDTIEGRAAEVSGILNDNIGVAFTSLFASLNLAAADLLSSEALDLPGKIEAIKNAAITFTDALQGGSTFGEALSITLGLEEDTYARFESTFNNLLIGFGELVAAIFELPVIGNPDAAQDIRGEIAQVGLGQAQFDITLAQTPDEIGDVIQTAIRRGVNFADVLGLVENAARQAADSGDFGRALDLARIAQENTDLAGFELIFSNLASTIQTQARGQFDEALATGDYASAFEASQALPDDAEIQSAIATWGAQLRATFDSAMASGDFSTAQTIANDLQDPALLAEVETYAAQLRATFDSAMASGDEALARTVADQLGDQALLAEVETRFAETAETAASATGTIETDTRAMRSTVDSESRAIKTTLDGQRAAWQSWAENAVLWIDKIGERITYVEGALNGFSSGLSIPEAASGSPVRTAAGGGTFGEGEMVETGHGGVELITMPREGSIINAANSSHLIDAIQAVTGMGGGNVTNNYININASQVMNAQSTGQATAGGAAFYKSLMGYGN